MVVRSQRVVRRRSGRDRGAAAVEFALVSPLLLVILFGVIDYGLYFADVLTVQQGVSDAARAASMAPLDPTTGTPQWGPASCTPTQTVLDPLGKLQLAALACSVAGSVRPLTGVMYAKAELVDASGTVTALWKAGSRIRVCTLTDHPPVLPFVPLPGGGMIKAKVDMPVQAVTLPLLMNPVATGLPAPPADWSWC